MVHGVTAEQIATHDEKLQADRFAAVDVAGYIGQDNGSPGEQYCGIWVRQVTDEDEALCYVGASKAEHKSIYEAIEKAGFPFWHTLQSFRGVDGQQKRCGVRTKGKGYSTFSSEQTPSEYGQQKYLSEILSDIDLSNAANIESLSGCRNCRSSG